jgi:hypothetical protein
MVGSRDRPPRVDLSASAGLLMPTETDWSDLVLLGSVSSASGVLVRDLQVEPGTVFGAAATYLRGRYGFRAHGARSKCIAVALWSVATGNRN